MDNKLKLPAAEKPEQTYLVETEDGFLLSVPESRLDKMQGKMQGKMPERSGEVSPSRKKQLVDRLVQMLSD